MSEKGGKQTLVVFHLLVPLMRRFAWLILTAAVLLGLLGAVFGYAAAEHYGWVLRRWLLLSSVSAVLLITVIARGARVAKVVAALVLALVVLAGIDPTYRIVHVGLLSP
jgi:hypothetical protein